MRKNRRSLEVFSLSFLDVVSCGFGAIVLLLVMIKLSDAPMRESDLSEVEQAQAAAAAQLLDVEHRSETVARETETLIEENRALQESIERLADTHQAIRETHRQAAIETSSQEKIVEALYQARQELSEELRRLQQEAARPPLDDAPIGGVPVDSEYIIFIIDTSGSMQQFAWPLVQRKMREILDVYPRIQGIQVMNDMGEYMFSQYAGRWIPDTPARRRAVLNRLNGWMPFSNSSPVEGIAAAVGRFYDVNKKISLYVFGDDFSRGSIQEVVDTVGSINRSRADGASRVRIHAIGFPVLFGQPGAELNVARFAALMRRLAEDNNGSFVGLTGLR